jgi:hypothetical protein
LTSPRDEEDKRKLAEAEGRIKSLGGEVTLLKNEVGAEQSAHPRVILPVFFSFRLLFLFLISCFSAIDV